MHVLVLPSWYPTEQDPYAGVFFRDWALAMQRVGMRVGVVFPDCKGLRHLSVRRLQKYHFQTITDHDDGFPCVRLLGWNPLAQYALGGLVWARIAQRAIDRYVAQYGPPDIIAAYGSCWAGCAAYLVQKRLGIPYVITEVDTQFGLGAVGGLRAHLARRVFEGALGVVAISSNLQRRLEVFVGTARPVMIPCTVNDRYWVLRGREKAESIFTFYTHARFAPRKGFDVLIRAFGRAFANNHAVRLIIGGDGVIANDLKVLAIRLGLGAKISFPGVLPRDAVRKTMQSADCFVLPSLAENFGVVLIEALATGLPVIATRCGGPEDFVSSEVGLLLEPADEDGLVSALQAMQRDEMAGQYSPIVLRSYAVKRFGYDVVGARIHDFLEESLAKRCGV